VGAGVSASMWDDEPGPVHDLRCDVMSKTVGPCTCGADEELHPADTFGAGFADMRGGYPIDDPLEDLLRPGAGTLADRLEELGRRIHPRDGDSSGGEVA